MKNTVLLFLCFATAAWAQDITKVQDYLPPSPEAQEFIKYGEYPVGMYTGVPNISIPLYTITAKEVQIPISLSYHASGIQVDQIASWAGLGWSLSTGGSISKIPRGIPDDEGFGFLLSTLPELNALVYDFDFYEDAASGQRDTESDIYHYNFAGYSGKFFFDRSKNVRLIDQAPIDITYASGSFTIVTKEGATYEFNDIERTQSVTYSLGNPLGTGTEQNYVSSWHLSKVTSKNKLDSISYTYETGTPFANNQYNYSESTGNDVDLSSCPPSISSNVHSGQGTVSSQVQTTQNPKRIKEIIFPSGKVVFNRLADRQDKSQDRLIEVEIYQKNNQAYDVIKSFSFLHNYFYSSHSTVYPANPIAAKRYRLKLTELHELDKNGLNPKKHIFGYDTTMLPPVETNGKDFWGYYNGKNMNLTLVPLQPNQYFGNNIGTADRNPDASFMKAGILNKITYPTGGYTEFNYEPHEYETTEAALITKNKNVFAVGQQNVIGDGVYLEDTEVFTPNYSGYATVTIEASDRNSTSGVYPRVTLQRAGSSSYMIDHRIDPQTYSYPMSPPEVNFSFPPVWLDKGVTYTLKAEAEGTSNSSEFDNAAYMIADIDYKEESTTQTQVTKLAGGLRIQQISSFSENNVLAFSKKYEYNNETLITPEVFIKEQYLDTEIEKWSFCSWGGAGSGTSSCLSNSTTRRFYYGGTVRNLTLNGGSPVVYGSVNELSVDSSDNSKGRTTYTYDIQTDAIMPTPSSYQGGIMMLKKDWMGGQNTSATTYAEGASDYITKETTGHTIKKYDESYKMYKIVHYKSISGDCTLPNLVSPVGRFLVFEYPIFTGAKLVNSTVKKTKEASGNEITQTTSIFYDNETHLQPTRTETTKSDGYTVAQEMFYPDDVDTSTALGLPALSTQEKNNIDRLKTTDLHQVSIPVQTVTEVKNSGGTVISTSTNRTLFSDFGNDLVLPESVKTLKGIYNSSSNPLESRLIYHGYDSRGNPIEVSQANGPHIYYIWGYGGTLPIAKLENVQASQITSSLQVLIDSAITASNADNDRTYGVNGAEGNLRTSLGFIRNHSTMSSALVTTYTYDLLLGITSTTDPSGYTMYYEYDDFNRLKEIRDADNNLVSDYEYNYKGQN